MGIAEFKCKWISKHQIQEIADNKREELWKEGIIPVDAETIVECRLMLEIIMVADMQKLSDMDAFLKPDLSGIIVDSENYMNSRFSNRMRFSFAHELGHLFLHRYIYEKFKFGSVDEWKTFMSDMPETEHSHFESQANEFAGRFLVPRESLEEEVKKSIILMQAQNTPDYIMDDADLVTTSISPRISRKFGVSETVIETRIRKEELMSPIIVEYARR